jgi:arabinofuranosyltransferase
MLTRTSRMRPQRAAAALVACAALAAFAVLARRLWPFTVDDTFITLRYARHLAAGIGPTFNAAPPRAEGFTSPLWMLLLAPPHVLGLDAVLAAKWLGVACTLASAVLATRWASAEARAEGGHPWSGAAAGAVLLALPATAVHAVSGMETALAALLLLALLACASRAVRSGGNALRALAPLALLLALARPEGVLAGSAVIVAVGLLRPYSVAPLARAGLFAFVLPLAALELARLAWFGLPLPLPFYVKLAHPGLFPGAHVVGAWLLAHAWRLGPLVLVTCARPPRSLWPALLAVALLTAFFTLPQHLMGYQHRYLAALDPVLAVLAALGLDRAVRFGRAFRVPRTTGAWAAPFVVALACAGELTDARVDVPERLAYAAGMHAAHLPLAHALAAVAPRGRLVLSDAGAIPYYTDWETLDLVGLNDARIARTHVRDPRAVLAFSPDAIVLVSLRPDAFVPMDWNAYETAIHVAASRAGFRRVALYRFDERYWLWVLVRPGSNVARALGPKP